MSQTSTNSVAHEMLQAAYNRSYRYPENFAGFNGVLRYSTDEQSVQGTVTIHAPDNIKFDLGGREGELQVLQREIASLCGHRWYAPYRAGDGRYTLSLDENAQHPLGQLVIFQDDPFKSSYRAKDGSVVQINRQMGTTRFTISIQDFAIVEGNRTLARQFTVAYWDNDQKRLMRSSSYTDHYIPIQSYYLPSYRRLIIYDDNGVSTHAIEFSAHQLS